MRIDNTNCCVFDCHSRREKNVNLSFHTFLKKKEHLVYITTRLGIKEKMDRHEAWIMKLKMGKRVTSYMRVCSLHFEKRDFILPDAPTKKPRLKSCAVPSQNLPQTSHNVSQAKSSRRRINRQLVNIEQELELTENVTSKMLDEEQNAAQALLALQSSQSVQDIDVSNNSYTWCTNTIEKEREDKEIQVSSGDLVQSFSGTITTDKELNTATGIHSLSLFNKIVSMCEEIFGKLSKKNKLPLRERILLTFMKLKNGLSYAFLSVLFKSVTTATCRTIFHETIVMLAKVLDSAIYWPSIEEIKLNMPKCFSCFQKARIVLDCTEIPVQRSKSLKSRIRTYSNYKKRHTIKFMTAVTPAGLIAFISKGYGGRCSDKSIFHQSGLMEKLQMFRDEIMVDKGFLIQDIADNFCVKVIQPPFMKKQKQFSKEQALLNQKIAKAHVHIERVNQRIKIFDIFNKPLPVSLWPRVDDIFVIACAIVNLSNPILDYCRFIQ